MTLRLSSFRNTLTPPSFAAARCSAARVINNGETMAIGRSDAAHLLRRAGFGGSLGEIDQLSQLDLPAAVDAVLDLSRADLSYRPGGIDANGDSTWEQMVAITEGWMDHCANAPVPVVEKMVLFWHGHLVVGREKVYDADYLWRVNALQRTHGLGNARTLVKAVAVEPAMLEYLDNNQNYAENPNQNFGRELLELFLLGIGNYTEDDVDACARAWTGHHLDEKARSYRFYPKYHDNSAKTFMGVTKNWDGPEIIDFLFADPTQRTVVAAHLVRRIWSFLAHPGAPANVVSELSAVLLAADFEIKPMLRALFLRPEFYSATAKEGLLRSPIEYFVNVMRQTGLRSNMMKPMWILAPLGQDPFDPPNVSGWKQNKVWLSAAATSQRADWAAYLGYRARDAKVGPFLDIPALPLAQAVTTVFERLGIEAPTAVSRQALTQWFDRQRSAQYEGWAEVPLLHQVALLLPELQLA
jgi:uncharacterized protein (DUF1800 family)